MLQLHIKLLIARILPGLILLPILASQVLDAQVACNPANATILPVCAKQKVFAGTQTEVGFEYTWFRNADLVEGPLSGNGGSISFGFDVYAPEQAGLYTIEKRGVDQSVTCVFNTRVVLVPLPLVQTLTGGGVLCNGQRQLSLTSSETGVSYQLIRNGSINVGSPVSGTGTQLNFNPVTLQGTYSVKAQKQDCFGNSFILFGEEKVSITPAPVLIFSGSVTARFSWSGSGNYLLEYGPAGFTPGTGASAGANGTVISVNTSEFTVSGLTAGTRYAVYARQSCGAGNFTSNSSAVQFSTDCSTVNTFPYTEGFESGTASLLPVCVKALDYNQDAVLDAGITATNTRTGSRAAFLDGPDLLVLPKMNISGNRRLRYFSRATGTQAICRVRVSESSNALSAFNTVLFTDTVLTGRYLEKTIDLSSFSGEIYLAFEGSAGGYILLDDLRVETTPGCAGPAFVQPVTAGSDELAIQWRGAGNYVLEYGQAGYIPGTGQFAGIGGTLVNNAVSIARITGLNPATAYDIYIREKCGTLNYSSNSSKLTLNTFVNCPAVTPIQECVNITASFTAGNGASDFEGSYPFRATGTLAPGKELVYRFVPSVTGVYYIETAVGAGSPVNYYYKIAGNCDDTEWMPVARLASSSRAAVGLLTGGTAYWLLLDREATSAGSQVFKICRAGIGVPAAFNRCIGTYPLNTKIPAFSPKVEYVIDSAGNVIAALDFSACGQVPGAISLHYYVHNGSVRRDVYQRELMNRSVHITSAAMVTDPIMIKMFLRNQEILQLVNEPDDGIADATGLQDLQVTQLEQSCNEQDTLGRGTLTSRQSFSEYIPDGAYLSFLTAGLKDYYIHAGKDAINQPADTLVICPGNRAFFTVHDAGPGTEYQWQVDSGSGFSDVSDNEIFQGVNSGLLRLNSATDSMYGYRFRCITTNGSFADTSSPQTLRFQLVWNGNADNEFLNPLNYDCGTAPGPFTDVLIPSGAARFPAVRYASACRSLRVQPGATLTVRPGVDIQVKGP